MAPVGDNFIRGSFSDKTDIILQGAVGGCYKGPRLSVVIPCDGRFVMEIVGDALLLFAVAAPYGIGDDYLPGQGGNAVYGEYLTVIGCGKINGKGFPGFNSGNRAAMVGESMKPACIKDTCRSVRVLRPVFVI